MKSSLRYNCILGGGAVRGIAYIGALRALNELNIQVKAIAGSSVGAIFASFYALDFTEDELTNIMLDFNFNMFKDISIGFGPDFALSKGGVFLNWLRDLIGKKYYGEEYDKETSEPVKFKDLNKDLIIFSTNLTNCTTFIFSKENTPDFEIAEAIKISASMPGLMKPTELDGKILVDGDIAKSWPLWKTEKSLCTENARTLEFRLEGCKNCNTIKNPLDYLNSVYSALTNFATMNLVELYNKKDKFDYIVIDTEDLLLVDFAISQERRKELVELGYSTTIEYFKNELPKKWRNLLIHYKSLNYEIIQLSEKIEKNDFLSAKEIFLEIFANLHEKLLYIDTAYYKTLKNLKNDFENSLVRTLFFKKLKLKSSNKIKQELISLNKNLTDKIEEIENYIS